MKKIVTLGTCIFLFSHLVYADNEISFRTLFDQGNTYFKQGQFEQAISAYKTALSVDNQPQVHFNLGLTYVQMNQLNNACEAFKKAVELNPSYTRAHLSLAETLQKQQKHADAEVAFRTVLTLDPANFDATYNLAQILSSQSKFDEAIRFFSLATQLNPGHVNALLDFANTLNMNNQVEEALTKYHLLLQRLPNNPHILYNIAYSLKKLNRATEAIPVYEKVLALDPEYAEAHFSLGLAYLITGNFEKGFREYEWRWKRSDGNSTARSYPQPLWDGSELNGKTIFIHAEQGLGDTFEFIRYAKIAKERGGKVVVAVQNPLVKLLSLCPYIDVVLPFKNNPEHFDVHAPMVSLPLICKTTPLTVPAEIPYLYADETLVNIWKQKLAADHNLKIGVCWHGNPNYNTHFLRVAVAAKSISAVEFITSLAAVPGVTLYSLQRESGLEELGALPKNINFVTFGPEFDRDNGRFMDTAALIKNLDLVITVDTSIAHLAAGLGAPVWLMLPNPPDWRWMLDRDDTPWYPNVRLFRQPKPGDWNSVLKNIKNSLQTHLREKRSPTSDPFVQELKDLTVKIGSLSTQERRKIHETINQLVASRMLEDHCESKK